MPLPGARGGGRGGLSAGAADLRYRGDDHHEG